MKVSCPDSSATYQVLVQGRYAGNAFEITENVYEFLPVAKREAVYFNHYVMKESEMTASTYKKKFVFEMSMIEVRGKAKLFFYVCQPTSSEQECLSFDEAAFSSKIE